MAKWQNHFISGKQFQKRPDLADLAYPALLSVQMGLVIRTRGVSLNCIYKKASD